MMPTRLGQASEWVTAAAPDPLLRAVRRFRTWPCRVLGEHYVQARGGALVAAREAIDPAQIRLASPYVLMIDLKGPQDMPVRLAGTGFRRRIGIEITGRNWLDIGDQTVRHERARRMIALARQPCAAWATWQAGDRRTERFEFVAFPLCAAAGRSPSMLIGAVASLDPPKHREDRRVDSNRARGETFEFLDIGAGLPPQPPEK